MNSTCCDGEEFSMAAKIVLSTWLGLAGVGTIVGNAIVLWLISRNRSLRTISNLFLTSLAASDLFVGLVIDPVYIIFRCLLFKTDTYWRLHYSRAIDYLWIHTAVATTFNLCCVTLDRHIAIFYPLRYENIVTYSRCYVLIATVWFLSLVLPCWRFLVEDVSAMLSPLYFSFTIITVLIPMTLIVLCSIRNLKAASMQSRQLMSVNTLQNQDAVRKRKKNFKAAKTISLVVGFFVACWLPSLVTALVHYVVIKAIFFRVWTPVEALSMTLSAINPWVYCLRNAEFYQALTGTFRFLRGRS